MAEASDRPPVASADEQLLVEHRRLRDLTRQIESSRDLPELLQRLEELRARLGPHFLEEEEADGFYDTIRRIGPRQLALVDDLQREHLVFLAAVAALAEEARACLAGPVAAVLAGARVLARRVREHEASENTLLLDTMYVDLGHGDG
jgi:hypothetical protein